MIEVLQLVMPDEATARAVHALVEHEHPAINALAARQSGSHGDRWVVQLPVGQALRFGLLPKGVAYENFETLLPKARITGDPLAEYRCRRVNLASPPDKKHWFRWLGGGGR